MEGFSTEIIKLLDDLGERFGVVIDWSSKNMLPYVNELMDKFINYKMCINWAVILIFIIVAALLIFAFLKVDESSDLIIAIFIVGACWIFFGGIVFICAIINLIELYTFPELYVFEYLEDMIAN